MSIYQFLIAVRQKDGEMLTNDAGETTRCVAFSFFLVVHPYACPDVGACHHSHLMGFFYRTIRIVENGIKPAYVFDGKPPELKAGVVCIPLAALTYPEETDGATTYSWQSGLKGAKKQRQRVKRQKRLVCWLPSVFCIVAIAHTRHRYHGRSGSFLATDSKGDSRTQ